jgi:hypothetical protein
MDNDPVGAAGAAAKPKRRAAGETRKGKTIADSKVVDVETWAKYYKRGYQNIVLAEDGSFLVLDPGLTKTDYPAALAEPVKTIRHLMGSDYRVVLANSAAPTELRAAAEEKLKETLEDRGTAASAARVLFIDAERELLNLTEQWRSAPNAPTRAVLAQSVAQANRAVMDAERALREALAPHRYIITDPVEFVYRLVPENTIPPERVITTGGSARNNNNALASNNE